uniref:Cytochrome P450 n=1 Tax=Photinus pyralis TaxID=7054 RepID=A0A1Y1K1H1_PHOPY
MLIYICLTSIFLAIYFYVNYHRLKHWKRKGVATLEPQFFFGNAKSVILQREHVGTALKNVYKHCRQRQLPFFGYYMFTTPILIVCDLDLVRKIMVTDFDHFKDRIFYRNDKEPLSLHLVSIDGARWKENRTKFAPLFGSLNVKLLYDRVSKCVDKYIAQLHEVAQPIELEGFVSKITLDVIACCLFEISSEFMEKNREEIVQYAEKFWKLSPSESFVRLMVIVFPDVILGTKIKTMSDKKKNLFLSKVAAILQEGGHDGYNFVRILQAESHDLPLENIAANWWIFFVVGYRTVSSLISFCLYELAMNQSYQMRVVEECKEINSNAIGQMRFLDQCLKETLRKYPASTILRRECTKEYRVPGTSLTINKGDYVYISTLGIHNDPILYPDPEKFLPERFAEGRSRHPCAYIPFGAGPRSCLGQRFAIMEAKIVVAKILKHFRISVNDRTDSEPLPMDPKAFVLQSANGIWINFQIK